MSTTSAIGNQYTIQDVGQYFSGGAGIYVTDEVVDFAREHGATIEHDADCDEHIETCAESEFAGCEFAGEYEDKADRFMNDRFGVEGAYWGRNECGDWGLWAINNDE